MFARALLRSLYRFFSRCSALCLLVQQSFIQMGFSVNHTWADGAVESQSIWFWGLVKAARPDRHAATVLA